MNLDTKCATLSVQMDLSSYLEISLDPTSLDNKLGESAKGITQNI